MENVSNKEQIKIRKGFVIKEVAGKAFVVATGALSREFHGMITLNETGKFIWNCLENGETKEQIIEKMLSSFEDVDEATLRADVDNFIDKLAKGKIIE